MSKKSLILIGGGGHAISVIDTIELCHDFSIIGIIDLKDKIGELVLDYPVIGDDSNILEYITKKASFHISLGQIKSASIRIKYYNELTKLQANIPSIVSPLAYLSKHSTIQNGTILLNGSKVNASVSIGANNIINTNANIEHGAKIGNHCHISTNAVINGDCTIGNEVFIGSNAVLLQGISVADNVIVGAGSIVTKSLKKKGIYAGNPCRLIKEYE